jgi:riboflavin kinase / FMN adenylyltransferase
VLVFNEIKPDLIPSSCLALGMFDGVHLGHQKVILDAIKKAESMDALSAIVTFADHPQCVTAKTPTKLITTLEDRLNLFEDLGVQAVVVLKFTEELSRMAAVDYLKNVLVEALHPHYISIGYDHRFGAQKKGNIDLLQKYSEQYNYEVTVIPPVSIDGQVVSSSVIRKFISIGDIPQASKLLGRPFSIRGKVIKGEQRGRVLGFPTANLTIPDEIVSPASGVYSGMVEINDKSYFSVVNVGKRPTFGDIEEDLIEVHILNFDGDLYGQEIQVLFLKRLRDEKKFRSVEELKEQIRLDCQMTAYYSAEI